MGRVFPRGSSGTDRLPRGREAWWWTLLVATWVAGVRVRRRVADPADLRGRDAAARRAIQHRPRNAGRFGRPRSDLLAAGHDDSPAPIGDHGGRRSADPSRSQPSPLAGDGQRHDAVPVDPRAGHEPCDGRDAGQQARRGTHPARLRRYEPARGSGPDRRRRRPTDRSGRATEVAHRRAGRARGADRRDGPGHASRVPERRRPVGG